MLTVSAAAWLLFSLLLLMPLFTLTVAVALLLTALLEPLARWLRRRGLNVALASLLVVLLLVAVLVGIAFLVGFRAFGKLRDLAGPLAAAIDRIRSWLVDGPLHLDRGQVSNLRNTVVARIYDVTPQPTAAARMALFLLATVILVVFLLFFLLKDGAQMWAWLLERVPDRRRRQVDGAGRCAWTTLGHYVRGVLVVACIDAVGIGTALLVLGVPLWVSLTLLTFIGAFIPLVGATVSGAVAVLVTLVTNGTADAMIVLVVVLVVQQVEGNLLQPLIVSRWLRLHPVAVMLGVIAGGLLWGLGGALVAVPLLAVIYQVGEHLRENRVGPAGHGSTPQPLPSAPVAGLGAPAAMHDGDRPG